jgi:hypothetical protein
VESWTGRRLAANGEATCSVASCAADQGRALEFRKKWSRWAAAVPNREVYPRSVIVTISGLTSHGEGMKASSRRGRQGGGTKRAANQRECSGGFSWGKQFGAGATGDERVGKLETGKLTHRGRQSRKIVGGLWSGRSGGAGEEAKIEQSRLEPHVSLARACDFILRFAKSVGGWLCACWR